MNRNYYLVSNIINNHNNLFQNRQFESISVKLLELFDREVDDNLNDNLLLTRMDFFGVHLVKLAMIGDCQKFIATETVQRVISDLWNNAVIFSPNKRLFSDLNIKDLSGLIKVKNKNKIEPFKCLKKNFKFQRYY